jgi:hypothetical protein
MVIRRSRSVSGQFRTFKRSRNVTGPDRPSAVKQLQLPQVSLPPQLGLPGSLASGDSPIGKNCRRCSAPRAYDDASLQLRSPRRPHRRSQRRPRNRKTPGPIVVSLNPVKQHHRDTKDTNGKRWYSGSIEYPMSGQCAKVLT